MRCEEKRSARKCLVGAMSSTQGHKKLKENLLSGMKGTVNSGQDPNQLGCDCTKELREAKQRRKRSTADNGCSCTKFQSHQRAKFGSFSPMVLDLERRIQNGSGPFMAKEST